jgi:septal ring factor EnvC (AmiA/AmiB activator)
VKSGPLTKTELETIIDAQWTKETWKAADADTKSSESSTRTHHKLEAPNSPTFFDVPTSSPTATDTETDTSAQDIKDLHARLVKIEEQLAKITDTSAQDIKDLHAHLVKIEEQLAKINDKAISGIQHPILANAIPRDPRWYEQPNIILAIIFLAALYLKH